MRPPRFVSPRPAGHRIALALEPLEPRVMLESGGLVEWLPGLVGPADLPQHTQGQVVYLDFDGAQDVTYNGPVTVEGIDVPAFSGTDAGLAGQEPVLIEAITQQVSALLSPLGVEVTATLPAGADYSTIYVGGSDDAFADYGDFYGLAEQVDAGSRDRSDIGFVFTGDIAVVSQSVGEFAFAAAEGVAHEAGHLLGLAHSMAPLADGSASILDDVAHYTTTLVLSLPWGVPVHQWLTKEAYWLYESQFDSSGGIELDSFVGSWSDYDTNHTSNGDNNDVVEGSRDEDFPPAEPHIDLDYGHLVAGADGGELLDGYEDKASAFEAAGDWFDQAIQVYDEALGTAYYCLGRVAHLLEDMTVPAHVHNDMHTAIVDDDTYEEWISQGSRYQGYTSEDCDYWNLGIQVPQSFDWLFRGTADYTEDYDSDDFDGWDAPGENGPEYGYGYFETAPGAHRPKDVENNGDLENWECQILADDLMPWAIEQVASLYRLFYSYVDDSAPVVSIQNPLSASESSPTVIDSTYAFAASASDPESGYDVDGFRFEVQQKVGSSWGSTVTYGPCAGGQTVPFTNDGVFRVRARVQNGGGMTGYSDNGAWRYIQVNTAPVPATLLSLTDVIWDDQLRDDDGVMEVDDHVRLKPEITASGSVSNVEAFLMTDDPNVVVTDDWVYFDDIPVTESEWAVGWFDMNMDLPASGTVDFTLHLTYDFGPLSCYQDIPLNDVLFRPQEDWGNFSILKTSDNDYLGYKVDDSPSISAQNNGDAIFQSGEQVYIYPQLHYTGLATAHNVDLALTDPASEFYVSPGPEGYPNLAPDASAYPEGTHHFVAYAPCNFSGTQYVDAAVTWEEGAEPLVLPGELAITVAPAAWLYVDPAEYSFGVTGTDADVVVPVTIRNVGTASLTVTGITVSDPADTTWAPVTSFPWVIPGGSDVSVELTIDTAALGGNVQRSLTVSSNLPASRVLNDTSVVTGLVTDALPSYAVPGSTEGATPDVSGSLIVWEHAGDIYAYDLATGRSITVCDLTGIQKSPKVSGSLVAWEDERAWPAGGVDIYAKDVSSGQEWTVAASSADERLIGVDGNRIGFARADFTWPSYGSQHSGYNIYYYDVGTAQTTAVTSYALPSDGVQLVSAAGRHGDFGDGVIAWVREEHDWVGGGHGWEQQYSPTIAAFEIGVDGSPMLPDGGSSGAVDSAPSAAQGKVTWIRHAQNPPYADQVVVWTRSGGADVLTSYEGGLYTPMLGGGVAVYEKDLISFPSALMYWDLDDGTEELLTDMTLFREWRADGNCVVWEGRANGAETLAVYYTFLSATDLSVASADITFSEVSPTEGEAFNVDVMVHNLGTGALDQDTPVRLYDGDPDASGILLAEDLVSAGVAGGGAVSVSFPGVSLASGGVRDIYVVLAPPEGDNPGNNRAHREVVVSDDDVSPPVISDVSVSEYEGDGDGVIGADEQFTISWHAEDASGVASCVLAIPGVLVPTPVTGSGGGYSWTGDAVPSGAYAFTITATDADDSPETSEYDGVFGVVPEEEITVLSDSVSRPDGYTLDLGAVYTGQAVSRVLIVRNDGEQALTVAPVVASSVQSPPDVSVNGPSVTSVAPGGITFFAVSLDTSALGPFSWHLSLGNSDGNEDPFDLYVAGTVVSNPSPVVSGLLDSPDPVTRPAALLLTATGVSDPDGTVTEVQFYRDANGNGTLEPESDTLLGSDVNGSNGWSWSGSTAGWPLGTNTYFARAKDNHEAWGDAASTDGDVLNAIPSIASLDASVSGDSLTLTAYDATDPDGTVERVAFYRDENDDGVLQVGTDLSLGDGTQSGDDWTLGPIDVSAWDAGTYTFFARAQDNDLEWSPPVSDQAAIGYRYVGRIPDAYSAAYVDVYDCYLPDDVALADFTVKFKEGGVSSVQFGGEDAMGGLGLVLHSEAGSQTAASVKDGRKGSKGDIAFIASDAPIKSIQTKGAMNGYNLNGLTLGGLAFAPDIDGDADTDDATAIYCGGYIGSIKLDGDCEGDIWIGGHDSKGVALGSYSSKYGGYHGDLTANGNVGKVSLGADFGSLIHVLGSLSSFQIKGGDFEGQLDVTGDLGKFEVKAGKTSGGWFRAGASVTVGGLLQRGRIGDHDDVGGAEFGFYIGGLGRLQVDGCLDCGTLYEAELRHECGDFCVELLP